MKFRTLLAGLLCSALVLYSVSCGANSSQPPGDTPAGDDSAANKGNLGNSTNSNRNADAARAAGADSQSAPQVAGTYRISGRNQNGGVYNGTLTITARGPVYHLAWQAGANHEGIGIRQGNSLAAGWGGAACAVASYRVQPDSSLEGQWTTVGAGRSLAVSTERAARTGAAGDDIAGEYTVTGRNPDGTPYRGALRITQRGAAYQFSWHAGNAYEGVGIRQGDIIAVGWGAAGCGVANYQIANNALHGVWGLYGRNESGTEEAVRQ